MRSHKKWIGLSLILILSACQMFPTPGPTPTPTITAGPSPSPTASPTATPLPTPVPVVRIESGDKALFFGDYEMAREQYLAAYNDSTDDSLKAAALWGLGQTELADGNYQLAIETLTRLTIDYPESTYSARAPFLMGQAYIGLKEFQQAAEAYNTYMERVPGVLDAYVQEYRGDAFNEVKDYANALKAYNAALTASRLDDGLLLQIKIANARAAFGDYAGALTLYGQVFNATTNDYIKAQMDYLAGNTYIELGQRDEANARYLHAVENYPLSYYSYLSLVELVGVDYPVSFLDRGLVDYYAGQYDVALVALDRYIAENPASDGTAHYYRAATLREMQQTQEAIQGYNYFIENYPSHPKWVDAWEDKAYLQWTVLGDYPAAAQTLLDLAAAIPGSAGAPGVLLDAARVLERNNNLEEAARTWERVANEYPSTEEAVTALFLAGISRYRLGDYQGALSAFQRDLVLAVQPEDRARAQLWIGKSHQKLGDEAAATDAWREGQAIDTSEYYSLRARDLILEVDPFAPPDTANLNPDLEKERRDAEAWMRITFELPADTDLSGPGALAQDARFIRGTELWELGMYDEARLEFESLRESISASPTDNFRLANHLLGIGLYRTAIFAARQVLTLAGKDSQSASLTAPIYFNHLRYGLYYHDLIIEESQKYGIDPLFMFSVIRQESLFEGFVKSTAGAHGLMQIIPSTGGQIANELNWPLRFDPDDLYRPIVSVRFGSYYLDKNRDLMDGSLYASLAAYNAGPGNALVWLKLAGDDPDLLLEIIRFQETRDYIRYIYEIFSVYRNLYGPAN
ncbi:MAG: tetratricopeptide repeat protein [Chloroflexi bacterium]|nr:tetratricopeptide repeat protein [Chloroflexota bacterium]